MKETKKELSPAQRTDLLKVLKTRFEKNKNRHKGIEWADVEAKLEADPKKLWVLDDMEETGGEPDVVGYDKKTDEYIFFDCSAESPKGRRSLCYDRKALDARKEHKPKDSAMDLAAAILHPASGNLAAPSLATGAIIRCSFITMELILIMRPEGLEGR